MVVLLDQPCTDSEAIEHGSRWAPVVSSEATEKHRPTNCGEVVGMVVHKLRGHGMA